jgi:hypothetical protein
MLFEKHVVIAAKAVAAFIAEQKPADIVGIGLHDIITEIWELDSGEICQVTAELIKMGYSNPITLKA